MKYSEILKDKKLDGERFDLFIEKLDDRAAEDDILKRYLAMLVNDGHFCEYTANASIREMVPVAYIGVEGEIIEAHNMHEYLSMLGVTPELAETVVRSAYERAKDCASSKGFAAPPLDINMWDAYHSIAMIFSDYWYTVNGCLETAAMIAYEYLSDPDRKR